MASNVATLFTSRLAFLGTQLSSVVRRRMSESRPQPNPDPTCFGGTQIRNSRRRISKFDSGAELQILREVLTENGLFPGELSAVRREIYCGVASAIGNKRSGEPSFAIAQFSSRLLPYRSP